MTKPKLTHARFRIFRKNRDFHRQTVFFYYKQQHAQAHVLGLGARPRIPANKQSYRATSVTISGLRFLIGTIRQVIFASNAIGSYSFDDQNNVVFNKLEQAVSTSPS